MIQCARLCSVSKLCAVLLCIVQYFVVLRSTMLCCAKLYNFVQCKIDMGCCVESILDLLNNTVKCCARNVVKCFCLTVQCLIRVCTIAAYCIVECTARLNYVGLFSNGLLCEKFQSIVHC